MTTLLGIEKAAARAELKQLIHDNPQSFEKTQADRVFMTVLNSSCTTREKVAELRSKLRELKAMSDKRKAR